MIYRLSIDYSIPCNGFSRTPTASALTLGLLRARIEAQQGEEVVQRLGAGREFLPDVAGPSPRGPGTQMCIERCWNIWKMNPYIYLNENES